MFAEFKPAPVAVMEGGREDSNNTTLWLFGGMLILVAVFAGYFLSVHRMVAEGDRGSTLQGLATQSQVLFDRVQNAREEAELERIHGEIDALLTTLSFVPEAQDMGTNLILQRTLHDMDALTRPDAVRDAESFRALGERLALISRSVRSSSPPTP